MTLPEFVYLITVDGQWPVVALAGDVGGYPIAKRIEQAIGKHALSEVHIWKVPVANAVEMELLPAATVRPQLRPKEGP